MNTNRLAVVREMSSAAAASSLVRPEEETELHQAGLVRVLRFEFVERFVHQQQFLRRSFDGHGHLIEIGPRLSC